MDDQRNLAHPPSPCDALSYDKAEEAWPNKRRDDEAEGPEVEFPRLKMPGEDVGDVVQARNLRSRLEGGCQDSHRCEGLEVGSDSTTDGEAETDEHGPEKTRKSSELLHEHDPQDL